MKGRLFHSPGVPTLKLGLLGHLEVDPIQAERLHLACGEHIAEIQQKRSSKGKA
jgi:hypothetical protein